jgi:hypothetical protein
MAGEGGNMSPHARIHTTALVFALCLALALSCDDDDTDVKEVGEITCADECAAAIECDITDIYDFHGETQTYDECIDTCETVHGADSLLEDECEELCQIDYMKNGDCGALLDCIGECWSQG